MSLIVSSPPEIGEEIQESRSNDSVEIIPYDLLEELKGKGVWGSALKRIQTNVNFSFLKFNKQRRECIYKPTKERRALFMLPSKPEEWFTNELTSAFQLKHENIIRIYGRTRVGRVNGILTEWVEGMSLKQIIHDKSISYTLGDIIQWNIQSIRALEYVIQSFPGIENEHFRRYFNRTVCAENMILNPTRDVLKICSLGLFKHIPDPRDWSKSDYSYCWAPEVRNGEYRYEESDVYPFSVVLWECIYRVEPLKFLKERERLAHVKFPDCLVKESTKFNKFIDQCTMNGFDYELRYPVSRMRTILENMALAEKGENLEVLKVNTISFWNDEEFYYCKELFFVEPLPKIIPKELIEELSNTFEYKLLKTLKVLGSGSFGMVCLQEYNGKKVAVKYLRTMNMTPLFKEFNVSFRLRHENLVKVIGQVHEKSIYGIVMEYIDGTSLSSVIHESDGNYTLGNVLKWNYQAALALEYMHFCECIHRDVKPDNMVIENSEMRTVKIVDLGGAKKILSSMNFTGMGTELYIAPEIDNGDPYDEKCDVYSWTITFWECCTAERPRRPLDYRSKVNQICSAKFVEVIEKCSSPDPSLRKRMFMIRKWLGDMVKNWKAFTETDSTFRENHICVWNEQTNELYYLSKAKSRKRFQNDFAEAKALFVNSFRPIDSLNISGGYEHGNRIFKSVKERNILQFSNDADEKYLENEFIILSKLKHENIVKLAGYTHDMELDYYGIFTENFYFFSNLASEINRDFYSTMNVVQWGLQFARGLEYMHSQNILHCDFKPANIVVMDTRKCKIWKFEVSRDLTYSYPKEAVGTGIYMAPEVRRDGLLTTKSDVYSWTVTFWELCKRQSFKDTGTDAWLTLDVREKESIDLFQGGSRYRIENGSNKFNDFIYTCSNEDPDKRWSMTDIVTLLENMMDSHTNSSYLPDFDNIQADVVVKDNICFWSNSHRQKKEKHFFYASANAPLNPEP